MLKNHPQIDADCSGTPYDLGESLGESMRDKIGLATEVLANFETFRLGQPWWMPYMWYRRYAEREARNLLEPTVQQAFPKSAAVLAGMAAGANVNLETLYLFQALESLFVTMACGTESSPIAASPVAACTAVGVTAGRSKSDRAIVAHNFDGVPELRPLLSLRRQQNEGQQRFLAFSAAPLAGVVDGINESGLCITYDWILATDTAKPAPPLSLAIEEALSMCTRAEDAIAKISAMPRCGGGSLMIADATGTVAALELSNHRAEVRYPAEDDGAIHHSNRFVSPNMADVQPEHDACFSQHAPKELQGHRILESAELRDERLKELLHGEGTLNGDHLTAMLSDHGAENEPNANTICMHGEQWQTLASLQFSPMERSVRVSYGLACEAEFVEFGV